MLKLLRARERTSYFSNYSRRSTQPVEALDQFFVLPYAPGGQEKKDGNGKSKQTGQRDNASLKFSYLQKIKHKQDN